MDVNNTSRRPAPRLKALALLASVLLAGCVPASQPQTPPQPAGLYGGSNETIILSARASVLHGLKAYEAHDWDTTRLAFDEALAILHRADLPESYKDLKLLQVGLPQEYSHYDLKVVHNQVRTLQAETYPGQAQAAVAPRLGNGDSPGHQEPPPTYSRQTVAAQERLGEPSYGSPFSRSSGESIGDSSRLPEKAFLEGEIVKLMAEFGEESYTVPEVFIESVQEFIRDYQGPRRDFFQKALNRSPKYVPLIATIFKQKKVPVDMAYMAMVESGFSPVATSRAKARGLWQFIRSTGRIYGLQINRWRDERLDPVRSTIAAREYFLDLVAIFGSRSFMLAMASYNAGEGRITSCLKKLDDPFEERNFWAIRGCLKRETREYVPRIIAATIVSKYPERYGFSAPEPLGDVDWMFVTRSSSISTLARYAQVPEDSLRRLNPDLDGNSSTPHRVVNYPLAVPKGTGPTLSAALSSAQPLSWDARAAEPSSFAYTVRKGDSLWTIGKRFGVEPTLIAQWNDIRRGRIYPGQTLVMHVDGQGAGSSSVRVSSSAPPSPEGHRLSYVVQKGNSLYDIGRFFGVSYRDIMRWNRLKSARIYPGQKLTIYTPKTPRLLTYRVKSGDILSKISLDYNVRLDYLMGYNGLQPGDVIKVGDELKIYRFE